MCSTRMGQSVRVTTKDKLKRIAIPGLIFLVFIAFAVYANTMPTDGNATAKVPTWVALCGGAAVVFSAVGSFIFRFNVETEEAPAGDVPVAKRLKRALVTHRLPILLGAAGVLLVSAAQLRGAFVVTGFGLLVGLYLKMATRTRKVATAFYLASGELLTASTIGATTLDKWRMALDKCYATGSTGLDTGLLLGWWAVPVLHPSALEKLAAVSATVVAPLPPDLHQSLVSTRKALEPQLDSAA